MLLKEKIDNARIANDGEDSKKAEDLRRKVTLLTKNIHGQTRDLELKLETSVADYVDLEAKHKELQHKYNAVENDLKNKEKDIISYKERGKELQGKIEELIKSVEEGRIYLIAEKKHNEELKNQLSLCRKECVDLVKKEAEAKSKVLEALQLFDLVLGQKNEAYNKIAEITGELADIKQVLLNAQREAESRYRLEMDEVKTKYNEKVTDMLSHIRNLDAELVEKGLLLNKALRENKILQTANDDYLKQQKDNLQALDPKLALAEQRLEVMFQELVASETRNMQLVCEKQCLAIDIQKIQDNHCRETKRRDWEEKLLRTQCEELKVQVEHLQKSLDETHGMVNKLQTMLSSRTELNNKMVSTKEEEMMELNKHLKNQMELNQKWKESYVEMTEKLQKRLEDLRNENKVLRNQLKLSRKESPNPEDSISASS